MQVPVGHLSVFFRKTSIQMLCLFCNLILIFLLLSCLGLSYILDINTLSYIYNLSLFAPIQVGFFPLSSIFTLISLLSKKLTF